ncbi:MAG: argininosuccinate lyase [Ignavibacteriae bacterium]|nr:argininosuccinate lyase [Ignavibacteriota bacterium]
MPLWNSRFRKPLADSALRFTSSLDFDRVLFHVDIDGSKAHVRMLRKQKIISAADERKIIRGLEHIRKEITNGKLKLDWRNEDIHTAIEERLVKKIGETGRKLHTARSRNDQIALDERLYLREEIAGLIKLIRHCQSVFLSQAEKHRSTIVPGYTHLQRAQPILFAHHLLAYVEMFDRDAERFQDCVGRANRSPLGAAALAGTSLPIDRHHVARQLKMDGVVENSIDAVSDRDVLIECVSACALTMMHVSRFAEEMVLWNSHEFSFARIDDSFATGSSLMPQKKNPDIAELLRGKVGRVYGDLIALLTIMKGLPLAYNRDLQENKEPLFDAVRTTRYSLAIAAELLNHTRFDATRFETELEGDLTLATDLVDYLVAKGISFRRAHSVVGKIVQECLRQSKSLNQLSLSVYKRFSSKFGADVFGLFTPRKSVHAKVSVGGTSGKEVERQLHRWRARMKNVL